MRLPVFFSSKHGLKITAGIVLVSALAATLYFLYFNKVVHEKFSSFVADKHPVNYKTLSITASGDNSMSNGALTVYTDATGKQSYYFNFSLPNARGGDYNKNSIPYYTMNINGKRVGNLSRDGDGSYKYTYKGGVVAVVSTFSVTLGGSVVLSGSI